MNRQDENRGQEQARAMRSHSFNMAEIMLRATARLLDIQASAARTWLQHQGRTASMFGMPDLSGAINGGQEQRVSDFFRTSTEQTLQYVRRANEAVTQVQREMGQLLQEETSQMTEQMRRRLDELGRQTEEGMQEVQELTRTTAEELRRTSKEVAGEAAATREDLQRTGQPGRPFDQPGQTPEALRAQAEGQRAQHEPGHSANEAKARRTA